jgi:hypothetical protein
MSPFPTPRVYRQRLVLIPFCALVAVPLMIRLASAVRRKFWLNKLDQFKGDNISAEMVKAFISSSEFRQRFGQ